MRMSIAQGGTRSFYVRANTSPQDTMLALACIIHLSPMMFTLQMCLVRGGAGGSLVRLTGEQGRGNIHTLITENYTSVDDS